ncbi:MAG TPA: sulfotransferase, partial [Acidimicrobiales bacterium]|nr:sulfotransferase [Acidimicrobiales bacterium]
SPEDYRRLFPAGSARRGDASPLYLYTERTPALIRDAVPDASIIALLREPVARAWSHFLYSYKGRPEEANDRFAAAVGPELAGAGYAPYLGGTHFLRLGLYARQVERYLDTFGPDRCLFLLQEELLTETAATFDRVVGFLGLPAHEIDTSLRYNQSSVAVSSSSRLVRDVLRTVQPYVKRVLPKPAARVLGRARASKVPTKGTGLRLRPETAARLTDFFAGDVRATGRLLGRSLADWLPKQDPDRAA